MDLYIAIDDDAYTLDVADIKEPDTLVFFTDLGSLFTFAFKQERNRDSYHKYYNVLAGDFMTSEDVYRKYLGDNWYREIGQLRDERDNREAGY